MVTGWRGYLEIRIIKEASEFSVRVINHLPSCEFSEIFVNKATTVEEAKEMAIRGIAANLDQPADRIRRVITWMDDEHCCLILRHADGLFWCHYL